MDIVRVYMSQFQTMRLLCFIAKTILAWYPFAGDADDNPAMMLTVLLLGQS